MALNAVTGSGNQGSTQTPQSASGAGYSGGASVSGVQPGTATNLLNGSETPGVPLQSNPLPAINLSSVRTTQVQQATKPADSHFNPALIGISAVFLVVAVVLFWSTTRAEKNTTD